MLNFIAEHLVRKEYQDAENRISGTKTYKTISRRNELFEYEFPFNPNIKKLYLRLIAKVIDYGLYYALSVGFKICFPSLVFSPFFTAFLALFLLSPLLESFTGKTAGKFVLGLEVIDDIGNKPSLTISYLKNILQLGIIIVYAASYATFWEDELFFHNKKTFTYTIKSKQKKEILDTVKNFAKQQHT
ncbi:RDD family protein [Cellulophaga sp. 20_2_10]|uniref:RDD family protein n=1 Tax=Cellulophaga sp. 20_2_10 TaxID=2942476 RepID=UPI00201AFD8F|nr:RDD family protein [Cellulophaga sp. 20_2_10]MCL5246616.1 RDD family protein [Cellulophaga sp. 20_2_10]